MRARAIILDCRPPLRVHQSQPTARSANMGETTPVPSTGGTLRSSDRRKPPLRLLCATDWLPKTLTGSAVTSLGETRQVLQRREPPRAHWLPKTVLPHRAGSPNQRLWWRLVPLITNYELRISNYLVNSTHLVFELVNQTPNNSESLKIKQVLR